MGSPTYRDKKVVGVFVRFSLRRFNGIRYWIDLQMALKLYRAGFVGDAICMWQMWAEFWPVHGEDNVTPHTIIFPSTVPRHRGVY
jgi:hypothetical protein